MTSARPAQGVYSASLAGCFDCSEGAEDYCYVSSGSDCCSSVTTVAVVVVAMVLTMVTAMKVTDFAAMAALLYLGFLSNIC